MTEPLDLAAPSVGDLLEAIASADPVPGGGAVAALTGAIGAALGGMVVAYSRGRKKYADHETHLVAAAERLAAARARSIELAGEDARAYAALNALWRLPADDPERTRAMPPAVHAAIAAPRATVELGLAVLDELAGLLGRSNRNLASDLAVAAILAEAACRAAAWNVRVNLPLLPEAETTVREGHASFVEASLKRAAATCRRIESEVAGG